ncbi:MAG TPA: PadR family transcriptional regulator [bacterium]|nr:PadR family transcriptional regulator [bacterium]
MELSKDLVAASATPLILAILEKGDNYGYAIIKKVKQLSDEEIQWTDGMLYPVLHRLEKQELINSYWQKSSSGRKRKYYRLTEHGFSELEELKDQWQLVNQTLNKVWSNNLTWDPALAF